jgi:electron transfer flavoprotein alpha subunit
MSVLIVAERAGAGWHPVSAEAVAAGCELARLLGAPAAAAVLGAGDAPETGGIAGGALERVWAVADPLLATYTADGYTAALESLIRHAGSAWVVLPHTYRTRDFGPKLAARFGRALVSDVLGLRVEGGTVTLTRQLFQGKLLGDFVPQAPPPCFFSVQAGAFAGPAGAAGPCPVELFRPGLAPGSVRTRPGEPFRESRQAVDLASAGAIVAVGRGLKQKEDLALIERLAAALGAEVAASRPVCDNGWLPMERQVGSSGQTVAPKLYVAIGISGAIQHLVGMKGSRTIVAINKDPDAPIFEAADYGIAGDLYQVVPALVEALR